MQAAELLQIPVAERIAAVFDRCFAGDFNTRLRGGAAEPIYRPAGDGCAFHLVEFTRDYPASALHEAAHWCLAGPARRELADYGYWYAPDGRSEEQQRLFEQVEVKPQALEWIFARACGLGFRVSADNLASGLGASESFKRAVWQQVRRYCREGLNPRAARLAHALEREFGRPPALREPHYRLAELG